MRPAGMRVQMFLSGNLKVVLDLISRAVSVSFRPKPQPACRVEGWAEGGNAREGFAQTRGGHPPPTPRAGAAGGHGEKLAMF